MKTLLGCKSKVKQTYNWYFLYQTDDIIRMNQLQGKNADNS